jgi:TRAP-type transport system small permease protein
MKHLLKITESVCAVVAVLCLAVMLAINMIQIFSRYLLNYAFVWVHPVTMLLFIWMTFLGAFVVYHRKKDIVVMFIVNRLPHATRKGVELVTSALVLFLLTIILAQAPALVKQQSSIMQIIPLPRYVQVIPLLIGLAGIFLDTVMDCLTAISEFFSHFRRSRGELS